MPDQTAPEFQPLAMNGSQTVSWIHIGDLHMVGAGEQNAIDLGLIVDAINDMYADGSVNFVFLPGDIADNGSVEAYKVVRSHLDQLKVPWFGIVGDHDVHEKSFANFNAAISSTLFGSFVVGPYRFLRLNAFSEPRPDSFILSDEQIAWMESELEECVAQKQSAVLFLHCYPSELTQGGDALRKVLKKYPVLLIDMGHTHYNEVSNDGTTLYSATRSTGQIEEGPVGFSIVTLDRGVVSWDFVGPDAKGTVEITHPADRRLLTSKVENQLDKSQIEVTAKVWASGGVESANAVLLGKTVAMRDADNGLWKGTFDGSEFADGVHLLRVGVVCKDGMDLTSSIEVALGEVAPREIKHVDHENSIGKWVERGLLDTQLGPNKNGKKW